MSDEENKEPQHQYEQVPAHMRTGMYRLENSKFWSFMQRHFSKVSATAIFGVLIAAGGWLGTLYHTIGDDESEVKMLRHDVDLLEKVQPQTHDDARDSRQELLDRLDRIDTHISNTDKDVARILGVLNIQEMEKVHDEPPLSRKYRGVKPK